MNIDELVAEMNSIVDPAVRWAIKEEFIKRFGRPKYLPTAMVDDACAWVADRLRSVAP